MHSKVISIPSAKFEPPPVHKMMTNNNKTLSNKKMKKKNQISKLLEKHVKLGLWAFVEVTRANEANNVFYCFIQSNEQIGVPEKR